MEVKIITFVNQCLKEFDYPFTHYDESIDSVLKSNNRKHLLVWFFKKLQPILFGTNDVENLNELLYQFGFCSERKAKDFVGGKLSFNEEILIYYKMFNYLKDLSEYEKQDEKNMVTIDDINNLTHKNINLFENWGPITFLSDTQRKELIEQYKEKIKQLRSFQDENYKSMDNLLNGDLDEEVENFDKILASFMKSLSTFFNENRNGNQNNELYKSVEMLLEKNYKGLQFINKAFENIGIIGNYQNQNNFNVSFPILKSNEGHFFISDLAKDVKNL